MKKGDHLSRRSTVTNLRNNAFEAQVMNVKKDLKEIETK